jgi:crotonobetaine/carnitine-CoA ligase
MIDPHAQHTPPGSRTPGRQTGQHDSVGVSPFSGRNVRWLLEDRVEANPHGEFLVWVPLDGSAVQRWSYSSFVQQVDKVAAGLRERGIERNQFVCVDMTNRPEFLFAWFAIQSLGAVMVATNTRSSQDELVFYLAKASVRMVLTESAREDAVRRAAGPGVAVVALDREMPTWLPPTSLVYPRVDSMDPAGVQFTSGTTSRPKGVVWTHANYLWGAKVSAAHEGLTAADRHLTYLPLFHTNAQIYSVMATLWAGGSVILMPKFSASRFWPTALSFDATWCSMINFSLRALLERPIPSDHNFRAWGVPVQSGLWEDVFGIPMIAWWGMTETVTHGVVSEIPGHRRPRMVGRAAPEYELRLQAGSSAVDDDDSATGVLEIRGRRGISMAYGYLDDESSDEQAWDADGWFNTGDRMRLHTDGWIEFVGRDKDMLKVGGENVAAAEIEHVIAAIDGVKEVAVVAAPDSIRGEVPVAFVIADDTSLPGEAIITAVLEECERKLADFKVPRQVRLVTDLPRATLEKVAKAKLREQLSAEMQ